MVPITKMVDGIPSNSIEMSRPKAKPNIKIIFESVAIFQKAGFKIPIIQRVEKPRYNPMMALKIVASSLELIVTSKS